VLYGFDIGGTKIAFAVYDQLLNCYWETKIATPVDYDALLTAICFLVEEADQRFCCTGAIGIGFPGAVNGEEDGIYCANVAALQGQNLSADLFALLARGIKLENDANCFLLSECYAGAAHKCATALGVTLGTGVGGAVFVNGALHQGYNAFAGEIGHYPIPATLLLKYPDLPQFRCGCGRQMCLETYISGTGLANLYHYYAQQALSSPQVIMRYQAGEAIACKVVEIYFDILAGGLSEFAVLNDELIKRLPDYLLQGVCLPEISKAKFGATGGVRGAALLNYDCSYKLQNRA
jgi:N-acetylglucosamine kinase